MPRERPRPDARQKMRLRDRARAPRAPARYARRWRARLVLLPGLHRFTLLDADGNAFVPAGVLAEPDEFGTMTALLAVPHR